MYYRYCHIANFSMLYKFLRKIPASWRTWSSKPSTRWRLNLRLLLLVEYFFFIFFFFFFFAGFAVREVEPTVSKSAHFRFLFQRCSTRSPSKHHRYLRSMVIQILKKNICFIYFLCQNNYLISSVSRYSYCFLCCMYVCTHVCTLSYCTAYVIHTYSAEHTIKSPTSIVSFWAPPYHKFIMQWVGKRTIASYPLTCKRVQSKWLSCECLYFFFFFLNRVHVEWKWCNHVVNSSFICRHMKEQRDYGVAQRQEAQALAEAEKQNLKVCSHLQRQDRAFRRYFLQHFALWSCSGSIRE